MREGRKIRVLAVDDSYQPSLSVKAAVEHQTDIEFVGYAETPEAALMLIEEEKPDVVLVDLRFKGDSNVGIDLTQRITSAYPAIAVVVFTVLDSVDHFRDAMNAGARGYIVKEKTPSAEAFAEQIRRAAAGDAVVEPSMVQALSRGVAEPEATASARFGLTPREGEVLRLVAKGQGDDQIAAELFVTSHTVETHIKHLYKKLGVQRRSDAVRVAYESGLVKPEQE